MFKFKKHDIFLDLPKKIINSAWLGHGPLALVLIDLIHPKILVELGTHNGFSYFSFCQAIKELGFDIQGSKCFAIDSWEGDPQAHFYGNEVYSEVLNYNKQYEGFSTLLRGYFDDYVKEFKNNSIDILHIDGLHTYEAVKHDFKTWLPKVNQNGVILFHDTNVIYGEKGYEDDIFKDFGVNKFFNELKDDYLNFNFLHSNGLGIICLSNKQPKCFIDFLNYANANQTFTQKLFDTVSDRIRLTYLNHELTAKNHELQTIINEQCYEISKVYSSNSWQFAKIVRKIKTFLVPENSFSSRLLNKFCHYKRFSSLKEPEKSEVLAIASSGLFDEKYYLMQNIDVLKAGIDPVVHFMQSGCNEGRNPSARFDIAYYLDKNFDIATFDINPLYHYLMFQNNEYRELKYLFKPAKINSTVSKEIDNVDRTTLISIIMTVDNANPDFLKQAVQSVKKQWYTNWELCIIDNASTHPATLDFLKSIMNESNIRIKFLKNNISCPEASNEALVLSGGEYIGLLSPDDELTPDALFEIVKAINLSDAEFIYSDEDHIADNKYVKPHFKPDFSSDMLLSYNYVSNLCVIKKSLIEKVEGFNLALEGAHDYDLILKISEHTDKIYHIHKVLYHSRQHIDSMTSDQDNVSKCYFSGEEALNNALNRRGLSATVENGVFPFVYRVKYSIPVKPLISIIIPFKDKPDLLFNCINSILEKSTYQNFEIIGISNCSTENKTFDIMNCLKLKDKRVKFFDHNIPFNYSIINNYAVNNYANGEHIVLLNNDIEVITGEWLEALLEHSQRKEVGAVGGLLLYPDNKVQHAGVIIRIKGTADHAHNGLEAYKPGYYFRNHCIHNISAVTAACLMVKKNIYQKFGGLNEADLTVAYNDVDFCLRLREKGLLNIYTPYCKMYHHESVSRGKEDTKVKKERSNSEIKYLKQRHNKIFRDGDPYYNLNLTLKEDDFSLKR